MLKNKVLQVMAHLDKYLCLPMQPRIIRYTLMIKMNWALHYLKLLIIKLVEWNLIVKCSSDIDKYLLEFKKYLLMILMMMQFWESKNMKMKILGLSTKDLQWKRMKGKILKKL